ncbi:MAG: thioredoxin-dependent thiol peroxidase [Candidatus Thermoplasmatota archaeon]|jgi:peroxiredoxin Q/BCP|nr:thioredoxin-dependent thiol peroxidase [Candidatus Thermoplasmatota archaeon]MCL5785803.1 thioredoxin-dependent thiol peroxidase [Candidatus Thermoplasmatota archaeon]
MAELLKVGDKAPDFEAKDQNGNTVKLSEYRGKPVVVYFYPKDDTPGCTTEACNFRDNISSYKDHGVQVLGVSVDSENSHKKFQDKYSLNFTLVSDKSKDIVEKYGVKGEFGSAKRVTYLVKPDGTIGYVYGKVTPKDHAVDVMEKLKELQLVR